MAVSRGRLYHALPRICALQHPRPRTLLLDLSHATPVTALINHAILEKNSISTPYRFESFSSKSILCHPQREPNEQEHLEGHKRKSTRSPAGKTSLRRVAVEAQRSRGATESKKSSIPGSPAITKTVTALCAAEQYDISNAAHILQEAGYQLDPQGTKLYPQVVHLEIPVELAAMNGNDGSRASGDVFIFPSGTVVGWGVPHETLSALVLKTLLPSAQSPHPDQLEEEDLEYLEDPNEKSSSIKGDTIIIGTKPPASDDTPYDIPNRTLDTVLAKIAFSSGLARSTKLAVLESSLSAYMASTRTIPSMLSRGSTPFTRSFILQKTGQLLSIRAQLNLYSELTDSLPDIFWDSRHELGLESYFTQVGRALDIHTRIKTLNERMDYASEIASVLREQLSGQHGTRLEWIIIVLITVEVVFGFWDKIKDYRTETVAAARAGECK